MLTKEAVYDAQIEPLMSQILAVCKEHKIANVCSFSLDRDAGLLCTSCMTTDDCEPPEAFLRCVQVLFKTRRPSPMMLTVLGGDGQVKEMHAIL